MGHGFFFLQLHSRRVLTPKSSSFSIKASVFRVRLGGTIIFYFMDCSFPRPFSNLTNYCRRAKVILSIYVYQTSLANGRLLSLSGQATSMRG